MKDDRDVVKAITDLLQKNLAVFKNEKLNKATFYKIYTAIFETLTNVFRQSNIHLSNEAANYIAQQYYDSIRINNHTCLDSNIFTMRASLDNLETKEIVLLYMIFKESDFGLPLYKKIKERQ